MTNNLMVGDLIRCLEDYSIKTREGRVYEIGGVDYENDCYYYLDDDDDVCDMDSIHFAHFDEYFEAVYQSDDEYLGTPVNEADNVNHPPHYTQGGVEVIDIIAQITRGYTDGFHAYCVGNALKYLARAPYKHVEIDDDIRKAAKYIEFITDEEK